MQNKKFQCKFCFSSCLNSFLHYEAFTGGALWKNTYLIQMDNKKYPKVLASGSTRTCPIPQGTCCKFQMNFIYPPRYTSKVPNELVLYSKVLVSHSKGTCPIPQGTCVPFQRNLSHTPRYLCLIPKELVLNPKVLVTLPHCEWCPCWSLDPLEARHSSK